MYYINYPYLLILTLELPSDETGPVPTEGLVASVAAVWPEVADQGEGHALRAAGAKEVRRK